MNEFDLPTLDNPHNRHRRQFGLTVLTAAPIVLIPWVVYLVFSLPQHYAAQQWGIAWVGFDAALVVCLALTSWAVWKIRQIAIPLAIVSATLLVCDAWFDITLDWGTSDLPISLLTAAFGELPMAGMLFFAAARMIRLTLNAVWSRLNLPGPVPPLHKVSLFVVGVMTERTDVEGG